MQVTGVVLPKKGTSTLLSVQTAMILQHTWYKVYYEAQVVMSFGHFEHTFVVFKEMPNIALQVAVYF